MDEYHLFIPGLLITLITEEISLLTFAPVWSLPAGGVKREVRFDSGAIPVAVKPPPNPSSGGTLGIRLLKSHHCLS